MAYQVISQNNTTTTLADENGNVIRVPARVSLATSTDYTIKKVNNTTATLEDGNGNIIRDVPCVAVLVGGEGGGGGAVSSVNGQTGDVVITGNDVLPTQTGQSGKFLTTDGTDASWSNQLDGNLDVNSNIGIRVKRTDNTSAFQTYLTYGTNKAETELRVGIGSSSNPWDTQARFILGYDRTSFSARTSTFYATGNAVDIKNLGGSLNKWTSIYVTKINNGADITVPAVAGELAVKQVNTTITLTAAGWSSNTQTVSVTGMTATGVVLVSPDPTDQSAYTSAGILCTAQAAGTLTFTCSTTPTADLSVNVVML